MKFERLPQPDVVLQAHRLRLALLGLSGYPLISSLVLFPLDEVRAMLLEALTGINDCNDLLALLSLADTFAQAPPAPPLVRERAFARQHLPI